MKITIKESYENFIKKYPEIVFKYPYSFQPAGFNETSYEIITCNYHHAFPELLIKEFQEGALNLSHQFDKNLKNTRSGIFFKGSIEKIKKIEKAIKVYIENSILNLDYEVDSPPIESSKVSEIHIFNLKPMTKSLRSSNPTLLVEGLLCYTAFLYDLQVFTSSKEEILNQNKVYPCYYSWFKDESHNKISWEFLVKKSNSLELKEENQSFKSGRNWFSTYLEGLRWYDWDLRIRRPLSNFCRDPIMIDNPLEQEVFCNCKIPCQAQENLLYDISRALNRPTIHVPNSKFKEFQKFNLKIGYEFLGGEMVDFEGKVVAKTFKGTDYFSIQVLDSTLGR